MPIGRWFAGASAAAAAGANRCAICQSRLRRRRRASGSGSLRGATTKRAAAGAGEPRFERRVAVHRPADVAGGRRRHPRTAAAAAAGRQRGQQLPLRCGRGHGRHHATDGAFTALLRGRHPRGLLARHRPALRDPQLLGRPDDQKLRLGGQRGRGGGRSSHANCLRRRLHPRPAQEGRADASFHRGDC